MDTQKRPFAAELLLVHRNELFLLLRDDKPFIRSPLRWSLLAGAVEDGETPEQAMHREVCEEIGIRFPVTHLCTTSDAAWFYRKLSDADVGTMRQGEGCARGFFSMAALRSLATLGRKGGLGGKISRLMLFGPDCIYWLLEHGTMPDENALSV